MCAPIALAGIQIASTLAQGAAGARDLKRQARQAEAAARAAAAASSAHAEYLRDAASRDTATDRVRAATSGADPSSESALASLSARHALRLDPALAAEHDASTRLYEGANQSALLKRASRNAIYRSLLGSAGTIVNRAAGSSVIAIP